MEQANFFDQISKNRRNSFILVFVMLGILYALLFIIAEIYNPQITVLLLSLAVVLTLMHTATSYFAGTSVVLLSTNATPANKWNYPHYYNAVEGLCLAAGIPKPELYVIPTQEINAFASGRDPEHAVIAVTEGALQNLNRQELEGVIAHEISHIGNYDIRYSMIVAVFVGLIAILSELFLRSLRFSRGGGRKKGAALLILVGIILAIFAPLISRLVQLSISRKREFLADATAAKLTRYPEGLASALEKIKNYNQGNMQVNEAVSHMFISDPKTTFMDSMFATHPPIDERIRILRAM